MSTDRDASALEAARVVAMAHGVSCGDAAVISSGSNVLVHLRPSPVVARVMSGTIVFHEDTEAWLRREVAVSKFAAGLRAPVVPPSDRLPPGPHREAGLWMTFSKFVPHDPAAPKPSGQDYGLAMLDMHRVLARYPGELEPVSDMGAGIARMLADLEPAPWFTDGDVDSLREELDRLMPDVFESSLPTQALHGDTSMSNALVTRAGLRWNDFEDVCAGPVAWDVAGLVSSAREQGFGGEFEEEVLNAYGDPGVADLEPFYDAHDLYAFAWSMYEAQRRPSTRGRAEASLARWRAQHSR